MTYTPEPARNPLALASFVLGVVAVLLGWVFSLVQAVLISSTGVAAIQLLAGANSLIAATLSVAAIATGVVALIGPRVRKPLAAAGVALGGAVLFNVIAGALTGLIYSLI